MARGFGPKGKGKHQHGPVTKPADAKKTIARLLSYIENGDITLIASTTENPFFYVYNAILSRSSVFEFKSLDSHDICEVLKRAVRVVNEDEGKNITVEDEDIEKIARASAGDVRRSLNMLEIGIMLTENRGDTHISSSDIEQLLAGNSVRYDREGDEHYDIISAYQKSMRGSDPDAAISSIQYFAIR